MTVFVFVWTLCLVEVIVSLQNELQQNHVDMSPRRRLLVNPGKFKFEHNGTSILLKKIRNDNSVSSNRVQTPSKDFDVPDIPYTLFDNEVDTTYRTKNLSSDGHRERRSIIDRYVDKPTPKPLLPSRKDSSSKTRRLIAGHDVMIEEYPYTVSIQKDGHHWCGGALLNQRLIISTANCFWKSEHVSRMQVRAGSRFSTEGGQLAKIQEVMKHPTWSIRSNPDNDVALALLDRFIKFSHSVHSADLPNHAMQPPFRDVWVSGWGAQRRDGIFEEAHGFSLQAFHNYVMSPGRCNNVTRRFGVHITENFLCLTQRGMRAACTRDTGSPAVSDGVVWGVASWGVRRRCGTERYPSVFSFIASPSNLWFITNATHYLMADKRSYPFGGAMPQGFPG